MTPQQSVTLKVLLAQWIWGGCCIAIVVAVFLITNAMPDTTSTHIFTVFEFAATLGYTVWATGPLNRALDKIEGIEQDANI